MSTKRLYWPALVALAAFFTIAAMATALASSVDESIVDTTAPSGSVTLSPGDTGSITINLTVTGTQIGTATFKVQRDWTLSGGAFSGTNDAQFTVPPRAATDPPTTFSTTGSITIAPTQAAGGPFALAVGAFAITNTNQQGAKLGAGASSNYQVSVVPPSDSTPPVITPNVSGTLGTNGWYTSNVTLSWSVSDGESAITSSSGCGSTTISTDTSSSGLTLTCAATSTGGTASQYVTIKRDATAPTITGTPDPAANGNGWNNGGVTVSYACSDARPGSGLAPSECPDDDSVSGDGAHDVSRTIHDQAGNEASWSATINIDSTAPSIAGAPTTSANGNGWYNADVTVHFTCSDSGSGIASCEPDQPLGEGANQSVTGTATDNAGNFNTATVSGINVDETPPTITFVNRTPANGNGWNDSPVTVTWSCSDGLSGPEANTVTQTLSADGAGQIATGTCTDLAGNTASDNVSGINLDQSPPIITFDNRAPAANGYGWNSSDVTATWLCSDAVSDVVFASDTQATSTEGSNLSLTGTCEDLAGNTASDTQTGFKVDKTPPSVNGNVSPSANGNGWNNTDVTVSFNGSDGLSGIDSCDAPVTLSSEGAGQSATGSCTDKAGNSASATASGINIDKTAPSVAYTSASPSPNANGWSKTDVVATFTATDGSSGFAGPSATETGTSTTSGEGAGVTVGSPAFTDLAGNTAAAGTATSDAFKIDKTAPVVSLTGVSDGATYTLGSVPAAGCSTTDALSGVDTNATLSTSGGPVGSVTAACSGGSDKAGNTSSASAAYNVVYSWMGFLQPVDNHNFNSAKAGSAIPVKFNLGGNQGLDILKENYPRITQTTCPGSNAYVDPIEEYVTTPGGSSLTYDTTAQQYIYVWKTQKTYAGKCFTFELGLKDGTSHTFSVQFVR